MRTILEAFKQGQITRNELRSFAPEHPEFKEDIEAALGEELTAEDLENIAGGAGIVNGQITDAVT